MRETIRRMLNASTNPPYQLIELQNAARPEPRGVLKAVLTDRRPPDVRGDPGPPRQPSGEGHDVLSLLLEARDEDGEPLTDQELRDELMTLVLAGHETTANSLAWTFERLLRTPAAYDRLRELVRTGADGADEYVEATIHEGMRVRPVIPMIVRMVKRPWRFGEYVVPAQTPVGDQHRRPAPPRGRLPRPPRLPARAVPRPQARDLHVDPVRRRHPPLPRRHARDGRAAGRPAGHRCADRPRAGKAASERAQQRNVTMIPRRGGRVVVERKR